MTNKQIKEISEGIDKIFKLNRINRFFKFIFYSYALVLNVLFVSPHYPTVSLAVIFLLLFLYIISFLLEMKYLK